MNKGYPMKNDLQRMYSVLDSLTESRLPERDDLALFIETCAPDLFSGPVPAGVDAMEAEFLREASMKGVAGQDQDHPRLADISKEDAIAAGKEAVQDKLNGTIVKEIYVPGRLVNIVVKP